MLMPGAERGAEHGGGVRGAGAVADEEPEMARPGRSRHPRGGALRGPRLVRKPQALLYCAAYPEQDKYLEINSLLSKLSSSFRSMRSHLP